MLVRGNVAFAAFALLLSVLLIGAMARAQTAVTPGRAIPIHFTATVTPTDYRLGEVVTVTVTAKIDPGWHLYAPASAAPAGTPATVSDITGAHDWQPVAPTQDDTPPETKFDANFHASVAYHEGEARLSRLFRIPVTEGLAKTFMNVVWFHYQVCDAHICLPPTTVQIPLAGKPKSGPVRAAYKLSAQDHLLVASTTQSASAPQPLSPWFFLAAAGAGLLALVTPCVFPLIPITLASFAKQANGDRAKLSRLAVGYALGVAGLYVALGGLMSIFAGAAGVNRLAANPWVNLFAFGVFVVFALSFFETVQIAVPSALTGAVQTKARGKSGFVSLALLGVVFVLASFTCTAPFVGTLLVASAGGERLRPLLGMAVFALAFTTPFWGFALLAATQKGDAKLLTRLPKSGAWLARVKATLGFVELAAALKFLSNADLVWQWKLLTQPVLLAAWALLFLLAALYLLDLLRFGVVAETETAGGRIPPLRAIWAGVFAGAALYCFWGLSGRSLAPVVATFLPPPGYGVSTGGANVTDSPNDAEHPDGLTWMTDYDAALAKAKASGLPLFIDFTGYTCTNCRWNERNVFPDAGVRAELGKFVRVQLYTDGGPDGAKNQTLQSTKFGDIALPLYGVVNPATGSVTAKTAGVQTVGAFTGFLKGADAPVAASATPSTISPSSALWQPYSDAALAAAKASGKPVVIDFTASWCVNCHQIEKEVFEEPATAARLGRETVTLRCDLTKWADPASAAIEKKWGIAALPTIVLIDSKGSEAKSLRITGRLSVGDFGKRLDGLAGK